MVGVFGVITEVDLHAVDCAGEPADVGGVVGADGGAGFVTDVGSFVRREDDALGPLPRGRNCTRMHVRSMALANPNAAQVHPRVSLPVQI